VLTTDQKGAIAETAIALAAVELGVGVSRPVGDERYDLIFDLRPTLARVQCKWATRYGDVIVVRCYRSRRNADGLLRSFYSPEEVDAFAVYCAELKRCYFLPLDCVPVRQVMHLRLTPTRNNQRLGIHWAKQYEFAATLGRHDGAIAQLGERLLGMQKVAGSSPAGSMREGARELPRPVLFSDC
jgi:PD-(D/E)XK endonuclease